MAADDPYGISVMTSQSPLKEASRPKRDFTRDARGNEFLVPMGVPTQEEADRIKGEM